MKLTKTAIVAAGCLFATIGRSQEPESVPLLAGKAFVQALDRPFGAKWENVDLRQIARRIAATRGTTLLLDRRLDPSRERTVVAGGEPLRDFLGKLADAAGGTLSVIGNTAYFGPAHAAGKLRTLAYLRQQELLSEGSGISRARRAALSQPFAFAWDDLTEPAELVRQLSNQHNLEVESLDLVPYDLWAGATLPQITLAEGLTLVLIQFDLTFEWDAKGERLRIVSVPAQVGFERRHLPGKGQTAAAALEQWRVNIPDLDGRAAGSEVIVRGTLEQHEAIERLRRPGGNRPATTATLEPLEKKRYGLRIRNTPARALMTMLAEPANGQLTFDYDDDALKQAGVNLDQLVTFEVKQATIGQLLKATFDPLKLSFELDDRTVRLKPNGK